MSTHCYKTVIIGAGPAGLAAAVRLKEAGLDNFLLIERDSLTGGILNQCIHNGFGLRFFREDLTGPEFARRLERKLGSDDRLRLSTMAAAVSRLDGGGFELKLRSRARGLEIIRSETIITATGCRERTRENIEVAGSRPAGVFTAGQAQALINREHYRIGKRVVIQGSGDIGLIMARRLVIEGFEVLGVYERLPYLSGSIRNKVQCLDHFGIPLRLSRQISCIKGRGRVEEVETASVDESFRPNAGGIETQKCDTVLFAAGLIPELETVKKAGISLGDGFHPDVDTAWQTSVPGILAAGNCLHINDLADSAAEEGEAAAQALIDGFKRSCFSGKAGRPYKEHSPDRSLNADYFKKLEIENLTVCIVCPKGCLLKEGDFGCRRGEEYYRRTAGPAGGFRQRVSTTCSIAGSGGILPAVSIEEIPVGDLKPAVGKLKEICGAPEFKIPAGNLLIVETGIGKYRFRLCRPEYNQ